MKTATGGKPTIVFRVLRTLALLVVLSAGTVPGQAHAQNRETIPHFLANGIVMDWWVRIDSKPPVIVETILQQLSDAGFTHLRYPLNPSLFIQRKGAAFTFDCASPVFTNFLERQIEIAKRHKVGLSLVVDASNHGDELAWLAQATDGKRLADVMGCLMSKATLVDSTYARDGIAYGTINEPKVGIERWNEVQSNAIKLVRKEHKDQWVLATGSSPSSINRLRKVDKVKTSRVIYEVHFYEPQVFTQQGALGVQTWMRNMRGVRFGSPQGNCDAMEKTGSSERCVKCSDGNDSQFCVLFRQQKGLLTSRTYIESRFDQIGNWANGDLIYIGEYGVNRRLLASKEEAFDRVTWLRQVATAADARGFGRAMYSLACWYGVTTRIACDKEELDGGFEIDQPVAAAVRAKSR